MKHFFIMLLLTFNNYTYSQSYKLIKKPERTLGCGVLAWVGEFLFLNEKDSTQFIGIIKCPDFLGKDFFKEDSLYTIKFSKDTIFHGYAPLNFIPNVNDKIPTALIDKIEIVK
jgi:hypothetical protein